MLLTAKPVIYLINLSEKDYQRKKNKWLAKTFQWISVSQSDVVFTAESFALGSWRRSTHSILCGFGDETTRDVTRGARHLLQGPWNLQYLTQNCHNWIQVCSVHALRRFLCASFRAIQLIYFFTAGADEVKCWQIRKGSKAPQAAGIVLIWTPLSNWELLLGTRDHSYRFWTGLHLCWGHEVWRIAWAWEWVSCQSSWKISTRRQNLCRPGFTLSLNFMSSHSFCG